MNDMMLNEEYFNELEITNNDISDISDNTGIAYSMLDEFIEYIKSSYTSTLTFTKNSKDITLSGLYEFVTELKKKLSYLFKIYNIEYSEFVVFANMYNKNVDNTYNNTADNEQKLYQHNDFVIITPNDFSEDDELMCSNISIRVFVNYPVFKPKQFVLFLKNIIHITYHYNHQICLIGLKKYVSFNSSLKSIKKNHLYLSKSTYTVKFGKDCNLLKNYDPVYFLDFFDYFYGKDYTDDVIMRESRYKEVSPGSGIYKDDKGDIYMADSRTVR